MSEQRFPVIPPEKFRFVGTEGRLHDKKLETKPIGYFRDAVSRVVRNKSSVGAAIIIIVLVLYAIIVPMVCQNNYTLALTDTNYLNYTKLPPRISWLSWAGVDGTESKTVNSADYYRYRAMGVETGRDPVVDVYKAAYEDKNAASATTLYYDIRLDDYYALGMLEKTLTFDQYEAIQKWQDETGIQLIYPAADPKALTAYKGDADQRANIWYAVDSKGVAQLDENGNYQPIYLKGAADDYHSIRIEGDDGSYSYARVSGTSAAKSYTVRLSKYNYFIYCYGFEPSFAFGTNDKGQDILTRLAAGARFSFILAICVSAVNLVLGTIYGSIEGYYGGRVDLVMERISDILSGIPFTVVTVLFQLHLSKQVGVVGSLLFAFVLTGWIGMAHSVRMQFYRFKGQEYVLAARTLGAGDKRIMFKHIFPNSLGTLITGCVLVIPGVIFSESSLTYLGIVNLESSTMTSVGTMLANGKPYLRDYPFIILFPSLFISLLEVSFNLFGNGLRDAFNPSLRGVE
ncbi:MAG: ABC transporter permease [Clostridia bacterium]|nr:ABC transporter permease [Clostridia bacterium]